MTTKDLTIPLLQWEEYVKVLIRKEIAEMSYEEATEYLLEGDDVEDLLNNTKVAKNAYESNKEAIDFLAPSADEEDRAQLAFLAVLDEVCGALHEEMGEEK